MEYSFKFKAGCLAMVTMGLLGCGSDDSSSGSTNFSTVEYQGKSTAAVIGSETKLSLAESSIKNVAHQINASDEVSMRMPLVADESDIDPKVLWGLLKDTRNIEVNNLRTAQSSTQNREVMQTATESGSCGGSVTFDGSENNWTAVFTDYCEHDSSAIAYADSYRITMNGSMRYSMEGNTELYVYEGLSYSARFGDERVESGTTSGMIQTTYKAADNYADYTERYNITMTRNGETIQMIGEETCTDYFNCTAADYYSEGDQVYKVEIRSDFTEQFDGTYSGAMTLYDPDHGYVYVSAVDLLPCESGFASGSIYVSDDSGNQMQISYNGCGQDVTLTLNGNAETASL